MVKKFLEVVRKSEQIFSFNEIPSQGRRVNFFEATLLSHQKKVILCKIFKGIRKTLSDIIESQERYESRILESIREPKEQVKDVSEGVSFREMMTDGFKAEDSVKYQQKETRRHT